MTSARKPKRPTKGQRALLPRAKPRLPLTFFLDGKPVTKKNRPRIFRGREGRPFVMPSAESEDWTKDIVRQLEWAMPLPFRFAQPLNLNACIGVKSIEVGDIGNYLAAICDALQAANVVDDDKWIRAFDGSRMVAVSRGMEGVLCTLAPIDHPEFFGWDSSVEYWRQHMASARLFDNTLPL